MGESRGSRRIRSSTRRLATSAWPVGAIASSPRGAGLRAGASRTLLAGRSPALPCRVGTPSRSRTLFQYRVRELPHADETAGSHLRSWRGSLRLGPRVACWRARPRPLRPHPRTRRPLGSPQRHLLPSRRPRPLPRWGLSYPHDFLMRLTSQRGRIVRGLPPGWR